MNLTRTAFTLLATSLIGSIFSNAPAAAQTLTPLHVVTLPVEPAMTIYYAKENGFFTKNGLDVTIEQNASTPAATSALLAGTIDIAYGTVPNLAIAHSKGLPLVIVAPGVSISNTHFGGAIMVGINSTAKTGRDLNGKTLAAVGLSTTAEFLPRAWIDRTGGDASTVKFIEIPFPSIPEAIASGRVDGGYLAEPFYTIALKKHQARLLDTGVEAIAPDFVSTVWFTNAAWGKAHADTVARFQKAMSEAADWANANQALCIPIIARYLNSDPALTAQTTRPYYPDRLIPSQVQPYIDIAARYTHFAPFPAADLIYSAAK